MKMINFELIVRGGGYVSNLGSRANFMLIFGNHDKYILLSDTN